MKRLTLWILFFGLLSFSNFLMAAGKPTLKIYYFHGIHRCASCIAIEKQTKVALENEMKELYKNQKVALEVLTIEDVKNQKLVEKYDIWGSSLILVDDKGNKLADLTEEGFMLARSKPDKFRELLKEKVYGFVK